MPVTANLSQAISPARRVAFLTLLAVAEGAYASDELQKRSQRLSARDAGLAAQLVFGCLRYQAQLDYLIFQYSNRRNLDREVRFALRLAIFQMRYLERIPVHAAVHESVELVKSTKRSAAGLVNAVLRKVNREAVDWPDRETELSCPEWLLARWSEHFGKEAARQIALAALEEPDAYVRIAPGSAVPRGFESTAVAGAYRITSEPEPGMRLHDISSQSIVPLLEIAPGDRYLDLCSAPGNKTLQALECKPAVVVACDISFRRLTAVPPVCPRVVLDATEPLPFSALFDRIFIDAPCSGTGTLARNPEIKWRLKPEDLGRFAQRQFATLRHGAAVLADNGKILYATCSLEREENEDVVRRFLAERPDFAFVKEHWRIPGRDEGDGFYAALLYRNR